MTPYKQIAARDDVNQRFDEFCANEVLRGTPVTLTEIRESLARAEQGEKDS